MLDKNRSAWYSCKCAGVVKLADALDSKSCGVKSVSVRVRPPAPTSKSSPVRGCFSFAHASDAAGVEMCAQMKRSKCAARLLLRVPVGGTRSARPTGLPLLLKHIVVLMPIGGTRPLRDASHRPRSGGGIKPASNFEKFHKKRRPPQPRAAPRASCRRLPRHPENNATPEVPFPRPLFSILTQCRPACKENMPMAYI